MTASPNLPAGSVVAGKLRILRLLGEGGMGAVYEVEHEFTKHRRALKLLHADMAKHEHVVARFLREASAAGRIGNRHIVESFDAGRLDTGEPFLVMELLGGETLEARLTRQGRLPADALADLVGQACDGVQAAHAAGIVHRDLKPENLFIVDTKDGPLLKILDFGISRFDPELTGGHAVTREGATLGTPYYMSPEQIEGDKDLDARADVYALGVILYECASGQRPYEAPALPMLSVLIHGGKPVPLADCCPDLPAGFADVVARAMAKNRDDRFATARELGDALARFGSSALGPTLADMASVPSSDVRVSVRATPLVPPPSGPDPKPLLASMSGSAVSVASESRRPLPWALILAASAIGVGGPLAYRLGHATAPSTASSIVRPAASAPSSSSIPSSVASVSPEPVPSSTVAKPPSPTTSASSSPAAAAVSPPPVPSSRPAATTHAQKQGLAGQNPYQ